MCWEIAIGVSEKGGRLNVCLSVWIMTGGVGLFRSGFL